MVEERSLVEVNGLLAQRERVKREHPTLGRADRALLYYIRTRLLELGVRPKGNRAPSARPPEAA